MKTPDEIKKGLDCCQTDASKSCKPCPYVSCVTCISDLNRDALAYIQQLEAAQPKWISVADRKPTETGSYIVCTDRNAVCTARYYAQTTFGGSVQNGYFSGKIGKRITHWMPLPEPPKEETC